jgi:hypothetical protein
VGEAKRRQIAGLSNGEPPSIVRPVLASAIRQVMVAVTDQQGADCIIYALTGAETLRRLGLPAKAVAGSAAWRLGPGAGDVMSHAPELGGAAFLPTGLPTANRGVNDSLRAGMFHAWIECGRDVIDFTTHQLAAKAKALDEADGGHTRVEWAPEYLWAPQNEVQSLVRVQNGDHAGAFGYLRKPAIEAKVLAPGAFDADAVASVVAGVLTVYRSKLAGNEIQVLGIDPEHGVVDQGPKLSLRPAG